MKLTTTLIAAAIAATLATPAAATCWTQWEGVHTNPGTMFQAMRNNSRRDHYATGPNGVSPKDVVDKYPGLGGTVGSFIQLRCSH